MEVTTFAFEGVCVVTASVVTVIFMPVGVVIRCKYIDYCLYKQIIDRLFSIKMKAIDRFYEYLAEKNLKPTAVEKEIGFSNGYLSAQKKRNADIGEGMMFKIIDYYRDINPLWLLTGEGSMLKTPASSTGTNVSYSGSTEPITTAIGNIGTSIQNGSNIGTSSQDKQVRKDNKDSLLLKAQLEIEFLKREIEILKNQLNQAILDKERAISDKDKAIEDKDKAMNMLVNMLNK